MNRNVLLKALACLVAGCLLPGAFAPFSVPLLAVLCPAVLFRCWLDASPRQAAAYGYLFGAGMFGTGVNWLHISINLFGGVNLAGSLLITFCLVAFIALYPALAGYAAIRLRGSFSAAPTLTGLMPAAWVLAEWLRTWVLTGFPWLHLGYSQSDTVLAGLAPVAGVFGVSFAAAFLAGALALFTCRETRWRAPVLASGMLLAAWLPGLHEWTRTEGEPVPVALVQGAVPQELKWRPELREQSLTTYRSLTEPHWDTGILVWPETAIPMFADQAAALLAELSKRAQEQGADLYIGLPVRNAERQQYFNSVLLLGEKEGTYSKRHLVPFGEYLPLKGMLGSLVSFLEIPMSDFSAGDPEQAALAGRNAVAGISICYEDGFGDEIIDALPAAELLINVSNDAWFGHSAAPHQHLEIARMRSIETGRWMLRATNTGISAIIDHNGRIVHRSRQFIPEVLTGVAGRRTGRTPYSRWSDWPIIILSALLLALPAIGRRAAARDQPA